MTRIYDLSMTHRLDADDLFIHRIQELCARQRLNFFLIEPLWAEEFYARLQKGLVWSRVLLNMHSEHHQPEELYHRLVRLSSQQGTRVIDPPDTALAAFDKALLHPRLIGGGIYVPYTIFVHHEDLGKFRLDDDQRRALGSPFVIKPNMGYGRRGVILDARTEADVVRCQAAWPKGNYLLQRRIVPREYDGRLAYFRIFYVFGSVWSCWWNCDTHQYRLTTSADASAIPLGALEDIARRIAALTGMQFFSTEVAHAETGELVVIDYVNDQCHLLSQSANPAIGVPDTLVLDIADRLVTAVVEMIRR